MSSYHTARVHRLSGSERDSGHDAFTFVRWNPSTLQMTGHLGELARPASSTLAKPIPGSWSRRRDTRSSFVMERLSRSGSTSRARRLAGAPFRSRRMSAVYQPMLGHFSATSDVIVYLSRGSMTSGMHITLVDSKGTPMRTIGEVAEFSLPSPVCRRHPVGDRADVIRFLGHTRHLDTRSERKGSVRLTFDGHDDMSPAWSADGRTILFTSDRSGERDLYRIVPMDPRPEVRPSRRRTAKVSTRGPLDGKFAIYDTGARASIDSQGRYQQGSDGGRRGRHAPSTTACGDTGRRIHGGHLAGRYVRGLSVDRNG